MLKGKKILLGVSGGIAAYKAADLARQLVKTGAEVTVVMTANAGRFITPLTFRTITGKPVATELFSDPNSPVPHISLARWPDLIAIVPATADLISRAACGRADDLLAAIMLDTDSPIIWAPAMNTSMWNHPATVNNLEVLKRWNHKIILPESGELACGEKGEGRLASLEVIFAAIKRELVPTGPLLGKKILITAGPTREPWDSIRYLSNRSSGKMGYALAEEAIRRGACVRLVSGPVNLSVPAGADFVPVETAQEMFAASMTGYESSDIVIAAAAVADFRPAQIMDHKIKKDEKISEIVLVPNPDILKTMGEKKDKQILVGFAAESDDPLGKGHEKMLRKNCDMMIANYASGEHNAFARDEAMQFIIDRKGHYQLALRPKQELAVMILDHLEKNILTGK